MRDALTINGKTIGENVERAKIADADVIRPYGKPLEEARGLQGAVGQSVRFRRS